MYYVGALPIAIDIGRQGENGARKIEINCAEFVSEWPGAAIVAMLRREGDDKPYKLNTSIDKYGVLTWIPTAIDTAIAGDGEMEIRAIGGNALRKSAIVTVCVARSLMGDDYTPEPGKRLTVDALGNAALAGLFTVENGSAFTEYVLSVDALGNAEV